jgi:hypothetical protein
MKKSTPKGTMKWHITTKMNDEDEKHALILSYAWKNSKVIYFMLTCYRGRDTIMVERQSRALVVEVPAPTIAQKYCIGIKGVDILQINFNLHIVFDKKLRDGIYYCFTRLLNLQL